MNKIYTYLFFVIILFIFVIFQTTLFNPGRLGRFYIDLTLILIIYLSLTTEIRGGVFFAFLSGYMIDLFSGASLGLYVISRLSLFVIIRFIVTKIYSDRFIVHILIIFFSIIYEWLFLYSLFSINFDLNAVPAPSFIIINVLMNTLVGYICFIIIKELHGKLYS
jgi:rod shape-determining protein MreD